MKMKYNQKFSSGSCPKKIQVINFCKSLQKLQKFSIFIFQIFQTPKNPQNFAKILLFTYFRPHQARETLRMMMVRQLKDRLHTVENFEKFYEVISQNLRQCLADLPLQYSIPKTVEQALDEIFAEEDSRKATEKETEENEEMEKFDPIKEEEIEKIVSWKLAKRIQDEK